MSWTQAEIRELKVNRYLLVDDEPCRILSIQMSKPGKHGEAKARLEVVGLFDGQKRSIVHPVTHKVRVPMIDKKKAQVLSIHGNLAQLMDLGSYQNARVVLFGVPFDRTCSFRAGSRWAPDAIREASYNFETYMMDHGRDILDVKFHDLGNLPVF